MYRTVFMGTSSFAVPALNALLTQSSMYDVVTVVTQPDRPKGRGLKLALSPVKVAAQTAGLPIWQPQTLFTPEAVIYLTGLQPDIIILASFGQILPKSILGLSKYGSLNLHPSLLPRWRGPSPVSNSILHGDHKTGVSLILMDDGVDTGDIIAQQSLSIQQHHTTLTLTDELSILASALLFDTLPDYLSGNIQPKPQSHALSTTCFKLRKQDGLISWKRSSDLIHRHIRAMLPWPVSFTTNTVLGRVRIFSAEIEPFSMNHDLTPGAIYHHKNNVYVVTGNGLLRLGLVQLDSRKVTPALDLINGYPYLARSYFY